MRIVNEDLLKEIRESGPCCWCGHRDVLIDAGHIFPRGSGRVDVRINLVPICRLDHTAHHAGQPPEQADLLALVAAREKCFQDEIRDVIWMLRRLPKNPSSETMDRE